MKASLIGSKKDWADIKAADRKRLKERQRDPQLTVRVPRSVRVFVDRSAAWQGMTRAEWLRHLLVGLWKAKKRRTKR